MIKPKKLERKVGSRNNNPAVKPFASRRNLLEKLTVGGNKGKLCLHHGQNGWQLLNILLISVSGEH